MKIRLWKLGSLKDKIYPTDKAFQKLSEMLMSSTSSGILDLIWGPDISVQEIELSQDDLNVILGATPEGYKAKIVLEALPAPVPDQEDAHSQP